MKIISNEKKIKIKFLYIYVTYNQFVTLKNKYMNFFLKHS